MIVDKFRSGDQRILKILMLLFDTCNNRCSFCFENGYHGSLDTIEQFKANVDNYVRRLTELVEQNENKFVAIDIKVMGGELFFDKSVEASLHKLFNSVQFSKSITWHIATNLIYDDCSFLVLTINQLCQQGFRVRLYSSYDFGNVRFADDESANKFYKNITYLISVFSKAYDLKASTSFQMCIETIKTKFMLKSLEAKDGQYKIFKELAKRINVSFAQLIGDYDFALTFDESVKLQKLQIDEFTEDIAELKQLLHMPRRNCFNITRYTITKDETYTGCLAQKTSLVNVSAENKIQMAKKMLQKYNCMTCKYFKMCNLVCPYERLYDRCDMFEVLNYISQNEIQL